MCALTILWLGPYIGCQIFSLIEVGRHNPDSNELNYFAGPALGLCILLYIATLGYICLPHSIGMVGIWVVSVVVCLSGHWFAYFLAEKHRTGPKSYQARNNIRQEMSQLLKALPILILHVGTGCRAC